MKAIDIIKFSFHSIISHKLRTALILIAMSIGIASVTILTALGAGAKNYIINEFSALGTHLLIVIPGRVETSGLSASLVTGKTPRDLTLNDARALLQSPSVKRIAPISFGAAGVSWKHKEREVAIMGSTHELLSVRHWKMQIGDFIPQQDIDKTSPVCVIGSTIRTELFNTVYPLGQWLRIGTHRCRIIGVLASEGQSVGISTDELVIVPVASALSMFNTPSLYRIMVEAKSREQVTLAGNDILEIIKKRHHNKLDVTVVTQDAVLGTFDKILTAITMGVTGIAAISLVVAGFLIMNVMLITVSQRIHEIGLLKALGAQNKTIKQLFMVEAVLLSTAGGIIGICFGYIAAWAIEQAYPLFEISPPAWAILLALITAMVTGLFFGTLPAKKASRLQPVIALSHR